MDIDIDMDRDRDRDMMNGWQDAERLAHSAQGTDISARPQSRHCPLPRPLSQEQRQRLLWEDPAGFTPLGMRHSAILAILLDTGLRGAELCTLTIDAVRDEECTTLLVRNLKVGREREVQLGPAAASALWRYLHDTRWRPQHDHNTERALFVMENGRPLDRRRLQDIVCAEGERVRVDDQPLIVQGLRLRVFAGRWAAWAAYQRTCGTDENAASGASDTDGASDIRDSEKGGAE